MSIEQAEPVQFRVAVAGEALIDLIARGDGLYEPCAGGAVFNLARAIARQGVATAYLNPLSGDAFGHLLADTLARDAVLQPQLQAQLQAQLQPRREPSSLALVQLDQNGQASYSFYREQVADRATSAEQLNALCAPQAALQAVCTGCLALMPQDATTYLPWLDRQKQAGRMIGIDANMRLMASDDHKQYRSNVMQALQRADVIKVSDDDLEHLRIIGRSPVERARLLFESTSASLIALTQGAQGAWLLHADGRSWHAQTKSQVAVVDSVGAGDCFFGGLMVALLTDPAIESDLQAGGASVADLDALTEVQASAALAHAVASATLCVQQRGCAPPTRAQALQLVRDGKIESGSH